MASPTVAKKSSDSPLRKKPKARPFPLNLYQTAVGKKWVMAVTGLMIVGFVVAHMLGNLKIYLGMVEHVNAEGEFGSDWDINIYSEYLRELLVPLLPRGYTLWLMRFGLIGAFGLHIHSAYTLTLLNNRSSRKPESKQEFIAANFASRSMRWTGVIILLYLLFHLADLTWGTGPAPSNWEQGEVYQNVVHSLERPGIAIIYIIANIAVAIHIFHGVFSMFQSLGVNNPKYNTLRRGIATGLALIIGLGNISFPIAILAGVVEI